MPGRTSCCSVSKSKVQSLVEGHAHMYARVFPCKHYKPLSENLVISTRHIALQHRHYHKTQHKFHRQHTTDSIMAPYGRGGAGNYEAIQRENEKVNNDLERSQSTAEKAGINYIPPDIAERTEAQYAHTGRGGAGNYYSPRDLVETGNFSGAQTSHIREFGVHYLIAFRM